MTDTSTRRSGRGLRGWTTRDLLVVAAIVVGLGLALVPVLYAGLFFQAALGPLVFVVVRGLFLLPQLMSLYVVRRPGAAVVAGIFFGFVQSPFTPFGWTTVPVGLLTGVVCELPFLLTRYRDFRRPMLLLAGAVAGLLNLALVFVPLGYLDLAAGVQIMLVVGYAVGGAVLGGLLAKLLADAVARTGALSGYAIGRERRGEV